MVLVSALVCASFPIVAVSATSRLVPRRTCILSPMETQWVLVNALILGFVGTQAQS
jgi:hypothetical protein